MQLCVPFMLFDVINAVNGDVQCEIDAILFLIFYNS